MRKSVDLPMPFGPTRPMRSPRMIRVEKSRSTACAPKVFETLSSSTTSCPDGTLLLASHDRAFLYGVVTSIYAFEGNGRVREYVGGYSDWRQASQARPTPAPRRRPPPPVKRPRQGLTYLEQRELETCPERLEALEAEQARLHAQLADPDLFRRDLVAFQTIMARLTALETDLPAAYARWEELERRQQLHTSQREK